MVQRTLGLVTMIGGWCAEVRLGGSMLRLALVTGKCYEGGV